MLCLILLPQMGQIFLLSLWILIIKRIWKNWFRTHMRRMKGEKQVKEVEKDCIGSDFNPENKTRIRNLIIQCDWFAWIQILGPEWKCNP